MKAQLYEKDGTGVICTACARYCKLDEGQVGLCGIRQNIKGDLDLLAYGRVITGNVDPIEKKPVTHYMPGSRIFSIATTGCNWLCKYCQNHDISQRRKIEGLQMSPRQVIEAAQKSRCQGIAYTYNQPSIFLEFAHDIGVLARKAGLINIFVSNGYDTPQGVDMMEQFLDCITVDFKGSGKQSFVKKYIGIPDSQPIYDTLLRLKEKKIHIEITNLIVPEVGDDLKEAQRLCKWVYDNLGDEISMHFLRFHPDYKMNNLPWTPIKTLERHYEIAKKEGLRYVYVGNVPGHKWESTYCPDCNEVLVKRLGFRILKWNLDEDNKCKCGTQTPIIGKLEKTYSEDRFERVL